MSANAGSIPTGPSDQYLRLLKGEITAKEYAKSVKKRVGEKRAGQSHLAGEALKQRNT